MYATITTAALAFAAARPPATAPAAAMSADGDWTIVVLEKDGQPVADAAKSMSVAIRGTTVAFNKYGTTEASPGMKAMRVEFAPGGVMRVTEAGDDNTFTAPTAPAPPPGTTPARAAPQAGVRTGVYVLTRDYLAVCVHDTATAQPGAGATPPAAAPPGGTSGVGDGRLPAQRSYVTVIHRRTEGAWPPASE